MIVRTTYKIVEQDACRPLDRQASGDKTSDPESTVDKDRIRRFPMFLAVQPWDGRIPMPALHAALVDGIPPLLGAANVRPQRHHTTGIVALRARCGEFHKPMQAGFDSKHGLPHLCRIASRASRPILDNQTRASIDLLHITPTRTGEG